MVRYCQHCQQYVEVALDAFSKLEICSICGLSMPDLRLASGTIVSGFQIVDEIGRGGMGIVYRAKQLNLERYVALKILSDELSMDLDFVDRFFNEARAAASLSHPNIVQAFDAGATAEGIYYLAMELIEGETLDRRISREGRLEAEVALSIAGKIADALNHAWERQKLCHGDIKPDNIILNSSGGAKLADLGLAKSLHEDVEHHHELMVTPFYAPPELINRDVPHINVKSDMYSFGATLYHMLSGAPPFRHQNMEEILRMHVQETPESLIKKVSEVKKPLSNLVEKLLAKNPEDRPESWEEVEESIEAQKKNGVKRKKKSSTVKAQTNRHAPGKITSKVHSFKSENMSHPGHISTPAPKEKIAPLENSQQRSSSVPLISFLFGLLIMLSLLVFFAMRWKHSASFSCDKETVLQEWTDLKTDLEFLPPEKALVLSKAFAEKYRLCLPGGVKKYIAKLEKDAVAEKSQKEQGKNFEKELNKLASDLRSSDMPRTPSRTLMAFRKRIDSVRDKINKHEAFNKYYPSFKKNLLDEKYADINSIFKKRKDAETARKRKEAMDKRIADRKKAIADRKTRERNRQRKLKIDAVTDRYYSLLADLMKNSAIKNAPVHVSVVFREWLEQDGRKVKEKISCLDRAEFIAVAFSDTLPVESLFVAKQDLLKGASLPLDIQELDGYKVEDIDSKAIKLSMHEGKVKFGKKIKWSRLESEDMLELLKFLLKRSEASSFNLSQLHSILAYLILNNHSKDLEVFMVGMDALDEKKKEQWRVVSEDFRVSSAENKAIRLWGRILENVGHRDFKAASEKLMELTIDHKDTLFFERYKTEIGRLLDRFKQMSPEAQALYMTAEFDKAMEGGKNPEKILELAMTAYIRYGSLNGIDEKLKQTLEDSRREAVSIISKNIDIKSVSENKLAFYKWEYEPLGEGYAFARFVRKSQLFKKDDPILKYLYLGACLDIGNWKKSRELTDGLEDCSLLLRDIGPLKEWAPSLLFSYGIAVERFGDLKRQEEALAATFELAESFEYGKLRTAAATMALEYAMRLRDYDKALKFAERYDYAKSRTTEDFRIALLNLLAMLQKSDMKPADFKDKVAEFRNIFKENKLLESDFLCCDAAIAMLEGGKSINGKRIYSVIKTSTPFAKDLCARILADALARAMYENKAFRGDMKNIKEAERSLWALFVDNPTASSLWNRMAVLRLIRSAGNMNDMERSARALLRDSRICALQLYPSLLAFNAGISSVNEAGKIEFFKDTLTSFLENCPVVSSLEQSYPKILYPGISSEEFSSLQEKCSPESAYWLYLSGVIANKNKPSIEKSIIKQLDKMSSKLRWQEKILFKLLMSPGKVN